MKNEQVESGIMECVTEKEKLYEKQVIAYLDTYAGTEYETEKKLNELTQKKLYHSLPEDKVLRLKSLVGLCEKRNRLGIQYAWEKGRRLTLLVSEGIRIGYPRTDDESVYEYLQMYKLEGLPAYRRLEEEIHELLNAESDELEESLRDISTYYTGLEFDMLRTAHYLGYMAGIKEFETIEAGFGENRDLTLLYGKRMEQSFRAKENNQPEEPIDCLNDSETTGHVS
ncbi:hypothetical protein B5F53_06370 [Blautia sp. An249]|uniref:hypothetical protein n=1 Tax=Blautia sp. An249 TaxID=1965603 RepID=UPI000B3ABDA3|nr:hypothetical protein [Blautia sp. An249]OUO79577.1 hypothetical protein B5F53_06370 [Blautia sp. An249]